MSTPAVVEGTAVTSETGDSYINLSNNIRPASAADSSARTSAMSTNTSRRGRSGSARSSQGATEGIESSNHNAVSSTSSANETVPEHGTPATAAAEDINLPQTLTPLMRIKLFELSTSSSESEGDENQQGTNEGESANNGDARRAASPPPNCAICLGRCKNKCFTDSCMHQFCFKCLCEWSKVKPECPLCKQTFKSIIHNVKSIDQFEEYHVQPPTVQIPHRPVEVTLRSLPYIFDAVVVEGRDWELPRRRNSAHRIRPASSGIFYPSDIAASNGEHGNSSNGNSVYNHLVYRNELLDMYRQEEPDAIASSGTLSQLWRRFIYDRRLFALPVCDITGRFRESTARFYRDNPAQVHRLMPWINRDIVCLLRNTEHNVSSLLERINESLLQTNILSPAFRRRLQPYLGAKTSHFIHELNNFARSPYDMIGYDRAVHYLPQTPEEIVIEFSSSASSDEGNASNDNERRTRSRNSRTRNDGEFRVLSRSGNSSVSGSVGALLSFTVSTTSEGTEAPGVTVSINGRSGQSAAINLSTHNRVSGDIIDLDDLDASIEPGTSRTANESAAGTAAASTSTAEEATASSSSVNRPLQPTVTENIELTSSSSDECEFVLERKPPHLRTPELVSLNSESDSDVVFVDESKPLRKSTFASVDDEEQKRELEDNKNSSTTQITTGLGEADSHTARDREELYNIGASTSTGLRSSGGGRGIKEMYERSRRSTASRRKRNLRSNRGKDENQPKTSTTMHRGKKIYESSCTSSNTDSTSTSSDSEDEDYNIKKHRTKSQRSSRNQKPKRSRRKGPQQTTSSSSNSGGQNCSSANSRKRKLSSSTNKAPSDDSKHFKTEAMSSDSEYSSDDSQNLIELQRRLQALKEQEKHGGTMEKINKTLAYLIDCEKGNDSFNSNGNANNGTEQMPSSSEQVGELQELDALTKQENFDSDTHENSGLSRLVEAGEESLDVAQNVCITSTNENERTAVNIAMEEDNTFSSTVTQTTTATTVTTTPANNRSISRASATTNNTNDNDNDNGDEHEHDNCNENDNFNSSETSSTSSSTSDTSATSHSLYSASSGGEEEEDEEVDDGNDNENETDENALSLHQLLGTPTWLADQLTNPRPANEAGVSTAQGESADGNESCDTDGLSPQRVEAEAVSLPGIEDDVSGIFLNQHDTSLVMPFNYDAEGSQSDAE
ncbi:E3 ubiquitin-protein ligase Topors [Bactrocera tryoni]|uniref:E3 ubiquitin-protein ligase Topors n=1 Tax=Bactrocera tryoni TaxID=59916 RepID=UPI001A9731EF|nr:E3 ubiquitin-protein ligase Topors [Bactrocera tryoni]